MNVLQAEQSRRNRRDLHLRQRRTGLTAGDKLIIKALRADIDFYDLVTITAMDMAVASSFLALRTITEIQVASIVRQNLCIPDPVSLCWLSLSYSPINLSLNTCF